MNRTVDDHSFRFAAHCNRSANLIKDLYVILFIVQCVVHICIGTIIFEEKLFIRLKYQTLFSRTHTHTRTRSANCITNVNNCIYVFSNSFIFSLLEARKTINEKFAKL